MSAVSGSKTKAPSASKRLLQELRDLDAEPNPAFERIGPKSDDDLFSWEAVMKGVHGTAYEGAYRIYVGQLHAPSIHTCQQHPPTTCWIWTRLI